ncbi:Endoglucanase C [bioreactor metagenome]|uniref:Endoglucanase C n=1 Tax=bioreactor metagenome TaxID=1076179 RepID=A0A645EJW2_9ZZZZ
MADKSETFTYLSPLAMHNIIYKVHMYAPGSFTHQRLRGKGEIVTYPGMIEGEMWNKERIRQNLQPVLEFQKRHNCKIYVGEFSAIAWAPGAEKYLNDCIEIFEEYGWDWTYHAFREWVGWSVEHEGPNASEMKPVDMTPRQKVLRRYFRLNER